MADEIIKNEAEAEVNIVEGKNDSSKIVKSFDDISKSADNATKAIEGETDALKKQEAVIKRYGEIVGAAKSAKDNFTRTITEFVHIIGNVNLHSQTIPNKDNIFKSLESFAKKYEIDIPKDSLSSISKLSEHIQKELNRIEEHYEKIADFKIESWFEEKGDDLNLLNKALDAYTTKINAFQKNYSKIFRLDDSIKQINDETAALNENTKAIEANLRAKLQEASIEGKLSVSDFKKEQKDTDAKQSKRNIQVKKRESKARSDLAKTYSESLETSVKDPVKRSNITKYIKPNGSQTGKYSYEFNNVWQWIARDNLLTTAHRDALATKYKAIAEKYDIKAEDINDLSGLIVNKIRTDNYKEFKKAGVSDIKTDTLAIEKAIKAGNIYRTDSFGKYSYLLKLIEEYDRSDKSSGFYQFAKKYLLDGFVPTPGVFNREHISGRRGLSNNDKEIFDYAISSNYPEYYRKKKNGDFKNEIEQDKFLKDIIAREGRGVVQFSKDGYFEGKTVQTGDAGYFVSDVDLKYQAEIKKTETEADKKLAESTQKVTEAKEKLLEVENKIKKAHGGEKWELLNQKDALETFIKQGEKSIEAQKVKKHIKEDPELEYLNENKEFWKGSLAHFFYEDESISSDRTSVLGPYYKQIWGDKKLSKKEKFEISEKMPKDVLDDYYLSWLNNGNDMPQKLRDEIKSSMKRQSEKRKLQEELQKEQELDYEVATSFPETMSFSADDYDDYDYDDSYDIVNKAPEPINAGLVGKAIEFFKKNANVSNKDKTDNNKKKIFSLDDVKNGIEKYAKENTLHDHIFSLYKYGQEGIENGAFSEKDFDKLIYDEMSLAPMAVYKSKINEISGGSVKPKDFMHYMSNEMFAAAGAKFISEDTGTEGKSVEKIAKELSESKSLDKAAEIVMTETAKAIVSEISEDSKTSMPAQTNIGLVGKAVEFLKKRSDSSNKEEVKDSKNDVTVRQLEEELSKTKSLDKAAKTVVAGTAETIVSEISESNIDKKDTEKTSSTKKAAKKVSSKIMDEIIDEIDEGDNSRQADRNMATYHKLTKKKDSSLWKNEAEQAFNEFIQKIKENPSYKPTQDELTLAFFHPLDIKEAELKWAKDNANRDTNAAWFINRYGHLSDYQVDMGNQLFTNYNPDSEYTKEQRALIGASIKSKLNDERITEEIIETLIKGDTFGSETGLKEKADKYTKVIADYKNGLIGAEDIDDLVKVFGFSSKKELLNDMKLSISAGKKINQMNREDSRSNAYAKDVDFRTSDEHIELKKRDLALREENARLRKDRLDWERSRSEKSSVYTDDILGSLAHRANQLSNRYAMQGGIRGLIAARTQGSGTFSGAFKGGTLSGAGVNIGGLVATTAITALDKLSKAIVRFGKASLQSYAQIERLGVQMEVVFGNKQDASGMFSEIQQYAVKSPFSVTQTSEMAVLLKQSGIYASDLMDTLKMIGDLASGNEEKFRRISNNFAQIKALGYAQTRDLREFANAGIPIYEALAKHLGVAQQNVRSMVQDGKITSEIITETFKELTSEGSTFFNSVSKGSKTYAARMTNLQDVKNISLSKVGNALFNAGGSSINDNGVGPRLLTAAENFLEGLGDIANSSNISRDFDAGKQLLATTEQIASLVKSIDKKTLPPKDILTDKELEKYAGMLSVDLDFIPEGLRNIIASKIDEDAGFNEVLRGYNKEYYSKWDRFSRFMPFLGYKDIDVTGRNFVTNEEYNNSHTDFDNLKILTGEFSNKRFVKGFGGLMGSFFTGVLRSTLSYIEGGLKNPITGEEYSSALSNIVYGGIEQLDKVLEYYAPQYNRLESYNTDKIKNGVYKNVANDFVDYFSSNMTLDDYYSFVQENMKKQKASEKEYRLFDEYLSNMPVKEFNEQLQKYFNASESVGFLGLKYEEEFKRTTKGKQIETQKQKDKYAKYETEYDKYIGMFDKDSGWFNTDELTETNYSLKELVDITKKGFIAVTGKITPNQATLSIDRQTADIANPSSAAERVKIAKEYQDTLLKRLVSVRRLFENKNVEDSLLLDLDSMINLFYPQYNSAMPDQKTKFAPLTSDESKGRYWKFDYSMRGYENKRKDLISNSDEVPSVGVYMGDKEVNRFNKRMTDVIKKLYSTNEYKNELLPIFSSIFQMGNISSKVSNPFSANENLIPLWRRIISSVTGMSNLEDIRWSGTASSAMKEYEGMANRNIVKGGIQGLIASGYDYDNIANLLSFGKGINNENVEQIDWEKTKADLLDMAKSLPDMLGSMLSAVDSQIKVYDSLVEEMFTQGEQFKNVLDFDLSTVDEAQRRVLENAFDKNNRILARNKNDSSETKEVEFKNGDFYFKGTENKVSEDNNFEIAKDDFIKALTENKIALLEEKAELAINNTLLQTSNTIAMQRASKNTDRILGGQRLQAAFGISTDNTASGNAAFEYGTVQISNMINQMYEVSKTVRSKRSSEQEKIFKDAGYSYSAPNLDILANFYEKYEAGMLSATDVLNAITSLTGKKTDEIAKSFAGLSILERDLNIQSGLGTLQASYNFNGNSSLDTAALGNLSISRENMSKISERFVKLYVDNKLSKYWDQQFTEFISDKKIPKGYNSEKVDAAGNFIRGLYKEKYISDALNVYADSRKNNNQNFVEELLKSNKYSITDITAKTVYSKKNNKNNATSLNYAAILQSYDKNIELLSAVSNSLDSEINSINTLSTTLYSYSNSSEGFNLNGFTNDQKARLIKLSDKGDINGISSKGDRYSLHYNQDGVLVTETGKLASSIKGLRIETGDFTKEIEDTKNTLQLLSNSLKVSQSLQQAANDISKKRADDMIDGRVYRGEFSKIAGMSSKTVADKEVRKLYDENLGSILKNIIDLNKSPLVKNIQSRLDGLKMTDNIVSSSNFVNKQADEAFIQQLIEKGFAKDVTKEGDSDKSYLINTDKILVNQEIEDNLGKGELRKVVELLSSNYPEFEGLYNATNGKGLENLDNAIKNSIHDLYSNFDNKPSEWYGNLWDDIKGLTKDEALDTIGLSGQDYDLVNLRIGDKMVEMLKEGTLDEDGQAIIEKAIRKKYGLDKETSEEIMDDLADNGTLEDKNISLLQDKYLEKNRYRYDSGNGVMESFSLKSLVEGESIPPSLANKLFDSLDVDDSLKEKISGLYEEAFNAENDDEKLGKLEQLKELLEQIAGIDTSGALKFDELPRELAKTEQMKKTVKDLKTGFVEMGKSLAQDGLSNTMATLGKSLVQAKDSSDELKENFRNLVQSMWQNVSKLMMTAGLQMISTGAYGPGLALVAASGLASFLGGMLDSDKDDDEANSEYERLKKIKDDLSDLMEQARQDSIYYEQNMRHQNSLSTNQSFSDRNVTKVNDAIITPSGNVISTHPDDYLIATKTPGSLIGGGASQRQPNISFNIVNNGTPVEIESTQQKDNGDDIELIVKIKDLIATQIASPETDDAFAMREARQNGQYYVR